MNLFSSFLSFFFLSFFSFFFFLASLDQKYTQPRATDIKYLPLSRPKLQMSKIKTNTPIAQSEQKNFLGIHFVRRR